MNVLLSPTGIKPNITFTVETPAGVILNQFNTGDINVTAQPQWKQYGFFFTTTPGNPDIVLRMKNNAPGGNGNDLALDDITFSPCGPTLSSSIQGNTDIVDICTGDRTEYDFNGVVSPGYISPAYQWQVSTDSGRIWKDIPGATAINYHRMPTGTGNYWYRLSVAESNNSNISGCRVFSNMLIINVHPKPVVNAGPDRTVIVGQTIALAAIATGESVTYSWSPPDFLSSTTILNPELTPDREISYLLSAVSEFGCTNEDAVLVKIVAGIFVPTAFTPNNDGKNDSWRIPYLDPGLGATVSVYNRWGNIVYQVTGAEVNWDGRYKHAPQPAGVYVYTVRFKTGFKDMKGVLTLIR
jgi:gliding motility-associated-like protein